MNDLNIFICKECNCWMDYHEVLTTPVDNKKEVVNARGENQGILNDFYSCPRCGSTLLSRELKQMKAA